MQGLFVAVAVSRGQPCENGCGAMESKGLPDFVPFRAAPDAHRGRRSLLSSAK